MFKRKPRPITTIPTPAPVEAGPAPMGREFVLATLARSEAQQQARLAGGTCRPVFDNLR